MGVQTSEYLDGDKFFASLDNQSTPQYIKSIKRQPQQKLKKCNLSFAEEANMLECKYKQLSYKVPFYQHQDVSTEFDRVDRDALGRISFERYFSIANAKYPQISSQVLINIYDYIMFDLSQNPLSQSKAIFFSTQNSDGQRMQSKANITINKQQYTQLMYLLHHYQLIRMEPIISLFLWVDTMYQYESRVSDLALLFYQHFGINSSAFLFHLGYSGQKQNMTISFKEFLQKLPRLIRQGDLVEQNAFQYKIASYTGDTKDETFSIVNDTDEPILEPIAEPQ
ncbi:Conserved_hypothetical protein [Hexamita inflata]|uniref:EF-hand domain-containing protein n=2 Tax=Hexamita inflata TaxID=28002 RepID=A0AA86QCN8_9EUKA|nr:Conserved hypothetical protein [Hexamita inflata]